MYILRSTQVPNEIFDSHLPYLNQAQLKVLLVVIRQVLGWIDPKTKKRKRKDWISISFFHRKTGLSHKSISLAISELIKKEIIVAMDYHENILKTPSDRTWKETYLLLLCSLFLEFETQNLCRYVSRLVYF